MGKADRDKLLRTVLFSSSLIIVVIGLGLALAGARYGWLVAAAGVIDAATVPFVLRAIGVRRDRALSAPAPSEAPASDPTADPGYNPYARED